MIFFTSDTHFGHSNIIKYSKRPFADANEMDEALVENWNKTVSAKDDIWHLGDIIFSKDLSILDRLNGKKHFLKGNHDEYLIRNDYHYDIHSYDPSWRDYYELKYKDIKFVLCHYPLLTWNKARYGSIHLHGHCHGTVNHLNTNIKRFDVGVDVYNYTPVSIDQIIEEANSKNTEDPRSYD